MESQVCTLVFLIRDNQILLARKKRGFGKDLWNGAGGKVESNETIEQAMVRECTEEIYVTPVDYQKVALHTFDYTNGNRRVLVHTYFCTRWHGEPMESEEMTPAWFNIAEIPYNHMWADDREWLPQVLTGTTLRTHFTFDEHNNVVTSDITETDNLERHG